ncbi:MAG: lipid II:glycine glycyltransferase FemX [Candidatus Promineifilaceae bacterium]
MSEYPAIPATNRPATGKAGQRITIVRDLDRQAWKEFIQDHPQGNIFHTPEMVQVYQETRGYETQVWAAVNDAGQILALMLPVQISLFNGPLQRITSRAVVFGSVLAVDGLSGEAGLEKLLAAYADDTGGSYLFTELRNVSDLGRWQPILERSGFIYEEHLNYLIDLTQDEEEMFGKVSSRTRSYIRKAIRQEKLELREVTDRADLPAMYELLHQTYQNAQVPLSDISLFENAFDILRPLGMARFLAVYLEERPIAVSIDLLFKDRVYYWYGGMDRDYSKQHPNEYLRWSIIQRGKQEGYAIFDFGGAGRPDQVYGVRDFKAKFGGDLVGYGRNVCEHSPRLLRLSTLGYGVVRKLL